MKTLPHTWRMTGVLLVCISSALFGAPAQVSPADYVFDVVTNMLSVTNGVRLAGDSGRFWSDHDKALRLHGINAIVCL